MARMPQLSHMHIRFRMSMPKRCGKFQTEPLPKFCFFVGESSGQLWNCHEGNDEDKNPEIKPIKKR
jgi:hypothetical protein